MTMHDKISMANRKTKHQQKTNINNYCL